MKEIINEYAEALFAIAAESGTVSEFCESLDILKEILSENAEYSEFLFCPALPLSERLSSVDEAFSEKFPEAIVSFIKILVENGRIKELPSCIEEFYSIKRNFDNTKSVTVYSSLALSEEQKEKLTKNLELKYKKKIHAIYEVDESLIGGIKIVAGDILIDGSIENRLKSLKEVIEK